MNKLAVIIPLVLVVLVVGVLVPLAVQGQSNQPLQIDWDMANQLLKWGLDVDQFEGVVGHSRHLAHWLEGRRWVEYHTGYLDLYEDGSGTLTITFCFRDMACGR